jgi:hypothetical protein
LIPHFPRCSWSQKWLGIKLLSYHLQALSIDLAVVASSVLPL